MNNEHSVACLDIGGTSVKSGVVRKDGTLCAGSLHMSPVDSGGTAEAILESFADSLRQVLDIVQKRDLILDCTNLEYINTSGLGTLLKSMEDFESAGGHFVLCGVPPRVLLTMEMLGFKKLFSFAPDVAAAVRLIAGQLS